MSPICYKLSIAKSLHVGPIHGLPRSINLVSRFIVDTTLHGSSLTSLFGIYLQEKCIVEHVYQVPNHVCFLWHEICATLCLSVHTFAMWITLYSLHWMYRLWIDWLPLRLGSIYHIILQWLKVSNSWDNHSSDALANLAWSEKVVVMHPMPIWHGLLRESVCSNFKFSLLFLQIHVVFKAFFSCARGSKTKIDSYHTQQTWDSEDWNWSINCQLNRTHFKLNMQ